MGEEKGGVEMNVLHILRITFYLYTSIFKVSFLILSCFIVGGKLSRGWRRGW